MATTEVNMLAFHTALAECADAIDSAAWSTAFARLAKARVILAGLNDSISDKSVTRSLSHDMGEIKDLLESARTSANLAASTDRIATTSTRFQS